MNALKHVCKWILILLCAIVIIVESGCQKTNDVTTNLWIGAYKATNQADPINSIIITSNGNNTLKVVVKTNEGGYIYVYYTLQHVSVTSSTKTIINENMSISGDNGPYDMQGSLTLSGSTLTMTCTASQGADTKNITFIGLKQ